MIKKILIGIFSVVFIILISYLLPEKEIISVPINEIVEYKIYNNKNHKKEINEISYDDLENVNISKNKFNKIMEYKEYMGTIDKIEDLKSIPRFTNDDIEKIHMIFENSTNSKYISHNINDATKKELKYLGLNNTSIKKIKQYGYIVNVVELKELIGKDYENIKGGVTF